MSSALRLRSLPVVFAAATLAACSGSSSGNGTPTVSLSVTDAASDDLSTFTIALESVELVSATNPPVPILQQPVAVDFAALGDLSRILNVTDVPVDVYTGVNVVLLYDNDRVHINEDSNPATLVDADDNALTGTQLLPIVFPTPLNVASGNYVVELDLDLNQSVDVDAGLNKVYFQPSLLPRVNRADPKEHVMGGDLRTVVMNKSLFRVGLGAPVGVTEPVMEVIVGPGTVFQIDGVSLLGAAGLAELDTLPALSWVQAIGSTGASSSRFFASVVEAGTGSFNGGTDIVEGVITGRTGGAGADAVLTVVGNSSDSTHTSLQFNLTYTVNTSFANTKVVRRGSATPYDTDSLNVGQRVRMFGALTLGPNVLDVTTATDVVRMEPVWLSGRANAAPASGVLHMIVDRVDQHDVNTVTFNWNDSGTNPPNPLDLTIDEHNLGAGQSIANATPVIVRGFFAPVDDPGKDNDASVVANRELLPSLLLIRDRANGYTVTTTTSSTSIDFSFTPDPPATFEKAEVDMGFAGQTDVTGPGISIKKSGLFGLGFFVLHDRTLNTVEVFVTFAAFSQALDDALNGGATLFNVGAVGVYDSANDEIPSALVGVTVQ